MVKVSRGGRRQRPNPREGSKLVRSPICEYCPNLWAAVTINNNHIEYLCCACWKGIYLQCNPQFRGES